MYAVELSQEAQKFLEKLDAHVRERVERRLRVLCESPVPSDAKFIERDEGGQKVFRIRIGDFRALYKVIDKGQIVLVAKIDTRPHIYDK